MVENRARVNPDDELQAAIALAERRDRELSTGRAQAGSHEEAMRLIDAKTESSESDT